MQLPLAAQVQRATWRSLLGKQEFRLRGERQGSSWWAAPPQQLCLSSAYDQSGPVSPGGIVTPAWMTEHTSSSSLLTRCLCRIIPRAGRTWATSGDLRALMSRTLCHTQFLSEVEMLTVDGSF